MEIKHYSKNIFVIKIISIILVFIISMPYFAYAEDNNHEEVEKAIKTIFENRNKALLTDDSNLIKSIYNTKTKYGTWAYEYEKKKMMYIHNWQEKQGIKFTSIKPVISIIRIRGKDKKFSANLVCSAEYKYQYDNEPGVENSFRIGTNHALSLINKDGNWIITKEWYKDPFGDSLYIDNLKVDSIKEYILSQKPSEASINKRREKVTEYANIHCGAANEEKNGFHYNKKYRNYNSMGGDCANFASQIMFEGGGFKKNGAWNYDKGGATRAWVNADGFKDYMIYSGRASVIARGSYEKVYKAAYKLQPGDFVAYEKKGDITHISTVTGRDSKGYALVSCHNTDRNKVPWDLGWSDKNIKFWIVHVNY
ncbi:MAG: amidase domain-containing protein [Clostridium sp.]|nr:amidase domain-containing protein [Clostridium sp.]